MSDAILSIIESEPALVTLANAGDVAGIVAALNTKTVERVDSQLYGPVSLKRKLPAFVVEAASLAFKAAAEQSASMFFLAQTYATCGFDFSAQDTRDSLDELVAGGMPQQLADALKSIGRWYETRLGYDVTSEQVFAALELRARRGLSQAVADRYNATIAALDSGEVTTLEQAKAFFAGA